VAPTTILVVEDDDSVRTIIDRTLSKAGYRVLLATCAAEGLEQLEHCAEHIDLVLSDIVMPGEIDGAQLAEIAATRWPTSRCC
jgi:CheY-like chemotaxis protein